MSNIPDRPGGWSIHDHHTFMNMTDHEGVQRADLDKDKRDYATLWSNWRARQTWEGSGIDGRERQEYDISKELWEGGR